jgi:hypothetical protein
VFVIFIPVCGIEGSAYATFLAVFVYNTVKIYFVKQKFNMQPFTMGSLKTLFMLVVLSLVFYFWEFKFHPIANIILKSTLISVFYFSMIYKMNVSEDISNQIKKYLRLK